MNKLIKLDPWFITGFADAESCFAIIIYRDKRLSTGWRVQLSFQIALHQKDKVLLEQVRNYFGVGSITKRGEEMIQYRVVSVKDLAKVIDHFEKYPLITQKRADYELFKQAIQLMKQKEHLTEAGLAKIVAIKASMNRGLSEELKVAFPKIIPIARPLVQNLPIPNPQWVAGFASGEGSFMCMIYKSNTKAGEAVQLTFQLTQNIRDEQLMRSLIEYFDCGKIYRRRNAMDLRVRQFSDINDKIIPFFVKYPILGVKYKDFEDFCKVANIMKQNKHLTEEGLGLIRQIKTGINKGRFTE